MHQLQLLLIFCLSLLHVACTPTTSEQTGKPVGIRHASLLHMEEADSFTLVRIGDAWHPGQTLATYLLVPRDKPLPAQLPAGTVVRTPIKRAALTGSVHAALFLDLGAENCIAAMADTAYVVSRRIRKLIGKNIQNMGSSLQPDLELLQAARPDALFVSPFENAGHGSLDRLKIPLIECVDYMETSPLGRAEWMRFYGRLVGQEARADSLFNAVEHSYLELQRKMAKVQTPRPTVMCDLRTGATWYQPGGASTMGRFITDAGGRYLWADRTESGSLPLDLETVYARAAQADIWLVKYGQIHNISYRQMAADCAQYQQFKPWKSKRIWACNTFKTPFYEEVPFHPERLLIELAAIFHPQSVSVKNPNYYHPL